MKRFLIAHPDFPNLVAFCAGWLAFCFGLWMAWPPLGPIGGGLILMAISLFGRDK